MGWGMMRVAIYARVSTTDQNLAAAARPHQPVRAIPLQSGTDAARLTRVFRRMWPCPLLAHFVGLREAGN